MISRDVVFDEERFWPWTDNVVAPRVPVIFDGDNGKEQQQLTEEK